MKEKIVLIGAGSAMFTRGLVADVLRHGWEGELALVDIDPGALEVAERLARKMLDARRAPLTLQAATDRREVLSGATAVICTVGVGGRRAWERDVYVPRRHGIYQPVGDTIMPGGSSRALRMIPAMVDIARDVLNLAPSALFFNYGNPMSAVCRGIRQATGAPVIGLCHGVNHVAHYIASALEVPVEKLKYTALGINHLTWFTEVRIDGQDVMRRLRAIAREKRERRGKTPDWQPDVEDYFTWQLVDLVGAFPAVLDRHVCEFFPRLFSAKGSYYGKTLGVDAFSFEKCIEWGDQVFAEMQEIARSDKPLPANFFDSFSGEHEKVTDIIAGIRNDKGEIFSANLPNRGQIPNLPEDAVVESPAVADAGGLRPIAQPPLAQVLAGTLVQKFLWVETIVEAALESSREKFAQALLIDGAVESIDQAHRLADDLMAAQSEYLPQFKRAQRANP